MGYSGKTRAEFPSGMRRFLFLHLVSHAPCDDARMITVATDPIDKIAFPPVGEETRISHKHFRRTPFIKYLIQHHNPHSVTFLKKFPRRRVVARPDGIGAHLPHYAQLAEY